MTELAQQNWPIDYWPVRIYYEDTDSGGVVYHANYLKYMERARTEWLRSLSLEQDQLIARYHIIFAVSSLSIKYLKPAVFNELLMVETQIAKLGKASIVFQQSLKRKNEQQLLCQAQVKVGCISTLTDNKKALPIPTEIYQILNNKK